MADRPGGTCPGGRWPGSSRASIPAFERAAAGYAKLVGLVVRLTPAMLLAYVALIAAAGWLLATTPKGFIPAQDRGYAIIAIQLPGGASLARTTEVVRRVEDIALNTPGVVRAGAFAGFNGATFTQSPSAAALFPVFAPWEERLPHGLDGRAHHRRTPHAALRGAGGLRHRHPAAAGARHRQGRRLRHAARGPAGRGTELLAQATAEMVAAATAGARHPARRHRLRMDRPFLPAGDVGQCGPARSFRSACCSSTSCCRPEYGSWSLPLAVLLIVPMCLLAASLGVRSMGQDINILTQIGFVVLVGLAAKNAILIVEFAKQLEEERSATPVAAVVEACRLRLRPILMTSLAFILGVVPLVVGQGRGRRCGRRSASPCSPA